MDDLFLDRAAGAPPQEISFRIGFSPSANLSGDTLNGFFVTGPQGKIALPPADPVTNEWLSACTTAVTDRFGLESSMTEEARASFWEQVKRVGALVVELRWQGEPWLEVGLITTAARLAFAELDAQRPALLSRFALLRRDGTGFVLESPRSAAVVRCSSSVTAGELVAAASGEDVGAAEGKPQAATRLLLGLGLATHRIGDGQTEEDRDPALRSWEHHDLYFHRRTRLGGHGGRISGTYRFRGELPPVPPLKEKAYEPTIALPAVDTVKLRAQDRPFADVVESRRSIRTYGGTPPSLAQLGEFLHRTARVTGVRTVDGETFTRRPYAAGGAVYELEVYVLAARCGELEPGLYHYDPAGHRLGTVGADARFCRRLLKRYALFGQIEEPQVALVLTARFRRVNWKYEGLAYALVLKHVGGLMDQFYLAATAMGLAPCALGAGTSDEFSAAIGADFAEESPVGEFLLGTRPETG